MPATTAQHADALTELAPRPAATDQIAARIFASLGPLHRLREDDAELLSRAAAGVRLIRSMGDYAVTHELFGIALAEIDSIDAFVVEAAACYAVDCAPLGEPGSVDKTDRRRALWLGAMLRLAEGVCGPEGAAADYVWAAWTDEIVYLEFRGAGLSARQLERALGRVAALEALTGRQVMVAGTLACRGAA